MKSRCMKYVPDLLHLEDEDEGEDHLTRVKRLRGTGIGVKSPAVFAEYAVSCTVLWMLLACTMYTPFA